MKKINLNICQGIELEVQKIIARNSDWNIELKTYPMRCGAPFLSREELDTDPQQKDDLQLYMGGFCLKKLNEDGHLSASSIMVENCFYLFLNKDLIDYYIKDGAYLFTTGWLINWKQHLKQWKFDKQTAREFFAESCQYFQHLDTGITSDSIALIKELSEYLDIEVRSIPIGLDYLESKLKHLLKQVEHREFSKLTNGKVSEYAMALDLVGKLSQNLKEMEVISNTLEISNILFAPGKIYYLSYKNGIPDKLYSEALAEVENLTITRELSLLNKKVNSSGAGECFSILFEYNGERLGIIKLCDLTFPEYIERYMNLGIFLGEIVSLTINNARNLKKVEDQQIEIEERSRQYHTLIKNLPEVVYSANIDAGRRFTFISERFLELTEYSPSDIINGSTISYPELIHPEDRNRVDEAIVSSLKHGVDYSTEYRIYTRSGKMKWVWEHGVGVRSLEGEITSLEGVISDITRRKDSEEFLKQEREHLSLIHRLLWHDVSNSLAVMRSGIRLYENYQEVEMLQEVNKQVVKASNLIIKMGQLTKTLTNNAELERIDVRHLIMKILDNHKFPISIKGECYVMADEAFYSVIDNLISNSITHAGGTKIEINLSENDKKGIILIADDGKGIPDSIKDSVFEESFKYGRTGNTGLGLYIVKKTVERYKGKIVVEDNHPQGAVFKIELNLPED